MAIEMMAIAMAMIAAEASYGDILVGGFSLQLPEVSHKQGLLFRRIKCRTVLNLKKVKSTPQKTSCWRFQFAAPSGFAGARVVLKDKVQKASERCHLSFTRLVAHSGTLVADKDWLGVTGFAPKQFGKPAFAALGKCAVRLETSADLRPPVQV